MRSTNRITTHICQDTDLATDSRIIDGSTQRTQVMMVTYTFKDSLFAVQEEPFSRNDFDGTDTERLAGFPARAVPGGEPDQAQGNEKRPPPGGTGEHGDPASH